MSTNILPINDVFYNINMPFYHDLNTRKSLKT